MPEIIDITIKLSQSCGTCKHYKNKHHNEYPVNSPELRTRFKHVPRNKGALGGYCLQNEKIRLTSRLAVCNAFELTDNKSRQGSVRKKTCTHEYALGCMQKEIASQRLNEYYPFIKFPYLRIRTWYYCKKCFAPQIGGLQLDNSDTLLRVNTYTIYISKSVSDFVHHNKRLPQDFQITMEDKNPDYYELADIFNTFKVRRPFPEGFVIKDTWNKNV